jgi:hypothetical protein
MSQTHVNTKHCGHELFIEQTSERTLTFWDFQGNNQADLSSIDSGISSLNQQR